MWSHAVQTPAPLGKRVVTFRSRAEKANMQEDNNHSVKSLL